MRSLLRLYEEVGIKRSCNLKMDDGCLGMKISLNGLRWERCQGAGLGGLCRLLSEKYAVGEGVVGVFFEVQELFRYEGPARNIKEMRA